MTRWLTEEEQRAWRGLLRMTSQLNARANRLANADHANLVRSSRAAHAQIQAVRRLEKSGALELLPPTLRALLARSSLASKT